MSDGGAIVEKASQMDGFIAEKACQMQGFIVGKTQQN